MVVFELPPDSPTLLLRVVLRALFLINFDFSVCLQYGAVRGFYWVSTVRSLFLQKGQNGLYTVSVVRACRAVIDRFVFGLSRAAARDIGLYCPLSDFH